MLAAHLVPGYLAAAKSQPIWSPDWSRPQRILLWIAALGSTVAPDTDVVYNTLFRGFFNHTTLWTHSIFVYLGLGLVWLLLRQWKRWPYLQTLLGLAAVGGMSHLLLDIIAHGTPLLYPVSMLFVSVAPERVIEGGLWAYLTDPVFLFEPLLFSVAATDWLHRQQMALSHKRLGMAVIAGGLILFSSVFILAMPELQRGAVPLMAP